YLPDRLADCCLGQSYRCCSLPWGFLGASTMGHNPGRRRTHPVWAAPKNHRETADLGDITGRGKTGGDMTGGGGFRIRNTVVIGRAGLPRRLIKSQDDRIPSLNSAPKKVESPVGP